jgi:hypothetical protein
MMPTVPGDLCVALPGQISKLQKGSVPGSIITNSSLGLGIGAADLTQSIDIRDRRFLFTGNIADHELFRMYDTQMAVAKNG